VDALHAKVSPSAVAQRKVEGLKSAARSVKDMVMGPTHAVADGIGESTATVGSAASAMTDAVSAAPNKALNSTQGNPLAAGVIAFGAGWLASTVWPASKLEREAAGQLKDTVSEHSDSLVAPLKESVDHLREPAREAVESVKSATQDAVSTVKDETSAATKQVSQQVQA
jgi:gas vesicle protein